MAAIDMNTLIILIVAAGALVVIILYFTKTKKIQTVDKMKILSQELIKSNQFNKSNPIKYVERNGKKLFRVFTASFFNFDAEKIYLFNVKPLLAGTRLTNPLSRFYTMIISDKNFQIIEDDVVLNHNFTLQTFYNIIFNSSDKAYDFIEDFSHMIDKNIVDSAFYAQVQRNTVVTFGTVAKDKGEQKNVELDKERIDQITGK